MSQRSDRDHGSEAFGDGTEVLDLRNLICPLPVLKTRRKLRGMAPGRRIRVLATDPLAPIDIAACCNHDGHRLLSSESREGVHHFLIERG